MVVKKTQKTRKIQEVVASETESQRFVLVGTYKKKPDQLAWIRKRRLYNYPLSEDEVKVGVEGWDKVKELWLYSGSKDRRHIYEAQFVGIHATSRPQPQHHTLVIAFPTGHLLYLTSRLA